MCMALGSMTMTEKKSKRVNENPNEFGVKSQFANLKMSGLNKCLVLNPFGIDSE